MTVELLEYIQVCVCDKLSLWRPRLLKTCQFLKNSSRVCVNFSKMKKWCDMSDLEGQEPSTVYAVPKNQKGTIVIIYMKHQFIFG